MEYSQNPMTLSRVDITINHPPEIDNGIVSNNYHYFVARSSHLVSCHPIEVSIRIHKLTYLGNVSVGHDPLSRQGLGLLLPKGEHTSYKEVFSL